MFQIASRINRVRLLPTVTIICQILALSSSRLLLYPLRSTKRRENLSTILFQFVYASRLKDLDRLPRLAQDRADYSVANDILSPPGPSSPSQYPCLHPHCGHINSRAHDLKRHMTLHFPPTKNELLDCKYEWCGRTGAYGFKREDHRKEHYRKVHMKESEPPKSGKSGTAGRRARELAPDAQALDLATATLAEDSNVQPSQIYGLSPVHLPPHQDITDGLYSQAVLSENKIPPKEHVPPASPPSPAALKVYGASSSENKVSPKECETTNWESAAKRQLIPSLNTETAELSRTTSAEPGILQSLHDPGSRVESERTHSIEVELDENDSSVAFMPQPSTEDQLATIASQVLRTLVTNETGQYCASLKLQWDILDFMGDQFRDNDSPNRDLGRVITISGSARHAQAATCSDYLRQNWPTHGLKILGALQVALNDVRGSDHVGSHTMAVKGGENCVSAFNRDTEFGIDISQNFVFLDIKSEASGNIVDVFQQLIWLSTALRTSRDGGIQYCEPKLERIPKDEETASALFNVTFEMRSPGEEARSCWFPLFTNPVIAFGFPTALRNDSEVGLEIPLDMMAALGGARHVVDFEGGLVMKGHSAMFVPLKRYDQSIQWHLILRSEEHRIRYRELGNECPNRAMLNEVDNEALLSTRAFLGWWPSSETHLGTADAAYGNIDWSSAREAKRPAKFAGANIGFQTMVTGQLNFIMGAKDGRFHLSQKGPFQRKIQFAENTPVVLYDIDDHRAWLVPALNVMLHIIQTRHHLSPYKINGKDITLTPVIPKNGKCAATEAVTSNQLRQLYDHDLTAETKYCYKDAILDLWSQIERLMEKEDSIESGTGLALHGTMQSQIYGWEYMSLVHEKNYRRKEAAIAKTSGGWVDLIKDIDVLVLFATGLGDIIKPVSNLSNLCRHWRTLPKGKDYLAVGVPILEMLYTEAGSRQSRKYLSSSDHQWHRGSVLFEHCSDITSCRCECDRTQQIYHDSLFRTFGHVRPPGNLEENGCVVFGLSRHPFKPTKAVAMRQNAVHILPNTSIQNGGTTPRTREKGDGLIAPVPPASISPEPEDPDYQPTRDSKRPLSPLNTTDGLVQELAVSSKRNRRTSDSQTSNFDLFKGPKVKDHVLSQSDDCVTRPLEFQWKPGHNDYCNKQQSRYTEMVYGSEAEIAPVDVGRTLRHKPRIRGR